MVARPDTYVMVDFNRKSKQILASASNGRIGVQKFREFAPKIAAQIQANTGAPWLGLWGESRNIDEHEHAKIVDPKILSVIGRIAKTSIRSPNQPNTYHAGLMHTYGYLFSQLKTRYGYKRERWTSGVIEAGLKLPARCLSPSPDNGTMLGNITFVLTRLGLTNNGIENNLRKRVSNVFPSTPNNLREFPFDKIQKSRIVESVQLKTGRKKPRQIKLFTDLISFKANSKPYDSLLIYSIQDSKPSLTTNFIQQKLITCFPINKQGRQLLITEARANKIAIRARYNAVIPGFPSQGITGERSIV